MIGLTVSNSAGLGKPSTSALTGKLAGIVTGRLKKAGYTMKTPGGVKNASKTTIYYQAGFQAEAQFLKEKHFPGAVVAPAPSSFKSNLTVVLGANFVLSS